MQRATENFDFFAWVDTLDDDEHHKVLEALREAARELGCCVHRKSLVTHQLLDLKAHCPTVISFN